MVNAQRYIFIDDVGGGLAAIAASVARSLGESDPIAATSLDPRPILEEVATVLREVGMQVPAVTAAADASAEEGQIIFLGKTAPAEIAAQEVWPIELHAPPVQPSAPGDPLALLEQLATARIVRDRLEAVLERRLPRRSPSTPAPPRVT